MKGRHLDYLIKGYGIGIGHGVVSPQPLVGHPQVIPNVTLMPPLTFVALRPAPRSLRVSFFSLGFFPAVLLRLVIGSQVMRTSVILTIRYSC